MTVAIPSRQRSRVPARACLRVARRWGMRARRLSEPAVAVLTATALALGTGWSLLARNADLAGMAVAVVVAVLSSLLLSLRWMLALLAAAALCLGLVTVVGARDGSWSGFSTPGLVLVAVTALVGLVGALRARHRDRLGLRQVSAETVLGLIRERTLVQARVPSVPAGWTVDIQQRPAHGAVLSGDFVANRLVRTDAGQVLHLAVIDVAGCGITAGPRALLLSGAVGGLLGSVPAEQFLAAVNDYLARQQGSVGLASAVYVQLDLDSGEYRVRVAGHPRRCTTGRARRAGGGHRRPPERCSVRCRRSPGCSTTTCCSPARRCSSTPTGWSRTVPPASRTASGG